MSLPFLITDSGCVEGLWAFYTMGSAGIISPIKDGAMNKYIHYKDLLQCH